MRQFLIILLTVFLNQSIVYAQSLEFSTQYSSRVSKENTIEATIINRARRQPLVIIRKEVSTTSPNDSVEISLPVVVPSNIDVQNENGNTVTISSDPTGSSVIPQSSSTRQQPVVIAKHVEGLSANWTTSAWGACSQSCGGGTQTRTVYCENTDNGDVLDDSICGGGKPIESRSCNTQSCASCTGWIHLMNVHNYTRIQEGTTLSSCLNACISKGYSNFACHWHISGSCDFGFQLSTDGVDYAHYAISCTGY